MDHFKRDTLYSILIKIFERGDKNMLYCYMLLEKQIPFIYSNDEEFERKMDSLIELIDFRLSYYRDKYGNLIGEGGIHSLQVMFVEINSSQLPILKNVAKVELNKNLVNIKEVRKNFNRNVLPLTMDESFYGERLKYLLYDENNKNKISNLLVDGENFVDKVELTSKLYNVEFKGFYKSSRFYLYTINNKKYVICIEVVDSNNNIKHIYNLEGLRVLSGVVDCRLGNNSFYREIGNTRFYFCNNQIIEKHFKIELPTL